MAESHTRAIRLLKVEVSAWLLWVQQRERKSVDRTAVFDELESASKLSS